MFITPLPVVDLIATGKLRALAVTAPERMPALKDVPTIVEQGFPDLVIQDWVGFAVKSGTPDEIVARLNAAINKALAKPNVREAFARIGGRARRRHAGGVRRFLKSQVAHWAKVVKDFGESRCINESSDFRVTLLGTGCRFRVPTVSGRAR